MSLEFTKQSGKEKFQISEALWDDFKDKVEAPHPTQADQDLPKDGITTIESGEPTPPKS